MIIEHYIYVYCKNRKHSDIYVYNLKCIIFNIYIHTADFTSKVLLTSRLRWDNLSDEPRKELK